MHELIIAPFLGDYLVLRPGSHGGLRLPENRYRELGQVAADGGLCPLWLVDTVRQGWQLDIADRPLKELAIVRPQSPHGYVRATYELNLGCNYDCEHCYLGLKRFDGLAWPERERLLHILRDAGVVWLQLTGGEPMIDKLFPDVYGTAYELGMMLTILSNGSRLANPKILELLTTRRPHEITISVYGATEASYDGLTRRRGAFKASASRSPAAMPVTASSTSTRMAWPASARSGATPTSRLSRKASKDSADSVRSPIPCCCVRAGALAARSKARAAPACRWCSSTARPRLRWRPTASTGNREEVAE